MRVTVIAASTVCGRIGPALCGSHLDRLRLEKARDCTDASLMGAETLRQHDPEMRGTGGRLPEGRIRAILTASGDIPVSGRKLFAEGPPPLIFTSQAAADPLRLRLDGQATVVAVPQTEEGLSIRACLAHLSGLGVTSLLVEGGGRLNHACFREGVVDELLLTLTPKLSGDRRAASLCAGVAPLGNPFLELRLLGCEIAETGELFLTYGIHKEGEDA
ncbi:MAG: RibD family protein [Thermodesulfobacteriota bacterium]